VLDWVDEVLWPAVANARLGCPHWIGRRGAGPQGQPKPFGEELRLRFALATAQAYTLTLYAGQGRLVQPLASGQVEAGQPQELLCRRSPTPQASTSYA
jgi:hypothetical protein